MSSISTFQEFGFSPVGGAPAENDDVVGGADVAGELSGSARGTASSLVVVRRMSRTRRLRFAAAAAAAASEVSGAEGLEVASVVAPAESEDSCGCVAAPED
eukprot:RCo047113